MDVQVKTCILLAFLSVSFGLTYHYGDRSYFVGSVDGVARPREGVQYSREGYVRYNGSYVGGLYHGEGSWFGDVGDFENGTVSGESVWDRPGLGVRLEGVFRRGHAHFVHGLGVVIWDDTGYR